MPFASPVNLASGKYDLTDDNKSLPEPLLTQIYATMLLHKAAMS